MNDATSGLMPPAPSAIRPRPVKKPRRLCSKIARQAWPRQYTRLIHSTVWYLPKKRSASQPPSSGKKYTPITKVWNTSFAASVRWPSGMYSSKVVIRNGVRMLRIP